MSEKFNTHASKTFKTPEDFGAVGYSTLALAAAGAEDNTSAMQDWADSVLDGERCYARAGKFYRCNSTVTITPVGELVMDGAIVTPNTDIVAVKVLDTFATAGNRTKIRCYNNMPSNSPVWLTKTYPDLFEASSNTALSVYIQTLPAWNSVTFYRPGDEVKVSGVGYRAIANSQNVTPPDASKWYAFTLGVTDGGLTTAQKLAAETNIGILVDTCSGRDLDLFANGYCIGFALKPSTLVSGVSYCAWNNIWAQSESGRVQGAIISAGIARWTNENKITMRGNTIGNSINTVGKSLYGFAVLNDDSVGNYSPNGNVVDYVDMEHNNHVSGVPNSPEFIQVVIHKGNDNVFRGVRSDAPGYRTAKILRHSVASDNPFGNKIVECTRVHRLGAVNNGFENDIQAKGVDDVLSLQFSMNDLGNKLVYSGVDKAMIRGLPFFNGTGFQRFDVSEHCFKHYHTYTNRIYVGNYFAGLNIYPGTQRYNSYWTLGFRAKGVTPLGCRYGFHCYNSAGTLLVNTDVGGAAGANAPSILVRSANAAFVNAAPAVGGTWQAVSDDLDDEDYTKHHLHNVRFSFHESVARAVFSFYGTYIEGFEFRAYNSPGAQVNSPASYSDENVVIDPPEKGNYTRPWRAMYENGPSQFTILDVGSSAFPNSWATSGAWAAGAVTRREERHVVSGTDYRIYRAANTGTAAGSAPTHTTLGQIVADGGGVQWEYVGTSEQLAAFVDL